MFIAVLSCRATLTRQAAREPYGFRLTGNGTVERRRQLISGLMWDCAVPTCGCFMWVFTSFHSGKVNQHAMARRYAEVTFVAEKLA